MAFKRTDQGYDVNAARRPTPPRPNGLLRFNGKDCFLWVFEVQTGFSMAGTRAQSYRTRSFFPHNVVQPAFTVMCQCANQQIYGDTIEFIRNAQTSLTSSMTLAIVSRSLYDGHKLKGAHEDNMAEGYIKHVPRAHNRHEYAPNLQFDFIVERYLSPSTWRDAKNQTPEILPSWKDIIEKKKRGFIPDPDPEQDQATLSSPLLTSGPNGENRPN
jgi:hypothetical protein